MVVSSPQGKSYSRIKLTPAVLVCSYLANAFPSTACLTLQCSIAISESFSYPRLRYYPGR